MTDQDLDSECVLVVDDEEDIRETLREVVQMGGCKARTAANGAEALNILRQHRPCMMILDLRMPVMTGEQLIAAMQGEPELADVVVLVSTSAPGRAPAGFPVLPKPVDISALWDWMRRTCHCADRAPAGTGLSSPRTLT